jgi:hypothetical protein
MSATPRLLSFAELEKLIRKGQESNSTANEVLYCTTMEYVEIVERLKKSGDHDGLRRFCRDESIAIRNLVVFELDDGRLQQSLFEHSDEMDVCGIWNGFTSAAPTQGALRDKIGRLVRRLILRPTPDLQGDADLYTQMEAWYSE